MKISSTLFTVSILFDNSHVLKAIAVSPPDIFLDTNKIETAQLAEEAKWPLLPIIPIAREDLGREQRGTPF